MGLKAWRHDMEVRDAGDEPRNVDPGGPGAGLSAEDDSAAGPDVRAGGEGWGALKPGFEIRGGAVWQTWESRPEDRRKEGRLSRQMGRCFKPGLRGGVFDAPELDDVVGLCGRGCRAHLLPFRRKS